MLVQTFILRSMVVFLIFEKCLILGRLLFDCIDSWNGFLLYIDNNRNIMFDISMIICLDCKLKEKRKEGKGKSKERVCTFFV